MMMTTTNWTLYDVWIKIERGAGAGFSCPERETSWDALFDVHRPVDIYVCMYACNGSKKSTLVSIGT